MNVKVGVPFRNKWERSTVTFLVPELTRIQLCESFWFVKIYTPNCLLLNLHPQSPQHLLGSGVCFKVSQVLVAQSCLTLCVHGLQSTSVFCPWDSPGKNPGVGRHLLLQGIFPTQGSNPGLLHCRQILYHLSHQGYISCCRLFAPRAKWMNTFQNGDTGGPEAAPGAVTFFSISNNTCSSP